MKLQASKMQIAMANKLFNNEALADEAGITPQTVMNAMNGKAIAVVTAGKIAKALGVDVAEIVKKED